MRHHERLLETQENQAILEDGQPKHLPKPRANLQAEAEQLAWQISDHYGTANPTEHNTTQDRRSCDTLSPAAAVTVSITRTISHRWAEEKCNLTDDCFTHERNKLAAHRAIATKAEQHASWPGAHVRTLEVQTPIALHGDRSLPWNSMVHCTRWLVSVGAEAAPAVRVETPVMIDDY